MAEETEFDRSADEQRYGENRHDDSEPDDETDTAVSNSAEPDVLLDVPQLKVDEIGLEVENLRAKVSLQAEVLDLVKLNVGADVYLGRVALEIKGVEARALLKVRLDNVAGILEQVLKTIDRNPQILENLTQGLGAAAREIGEGAGSAVSDVGEGAGSAVREVGAGAGSAVSDVGEGAGSAVSDVGEGAGSAAESVGEGAGSAVSDVSEGAGKTVDDAGDTARTTTGGTEPSEDKTADRDTSRRSSSDERPRRPRPPRRERRQ